MKRNVINKPEIKRCEICKKNVSLYSLSSHLKWSHKMTSDEYALKYGEFRKPKRERISNRNINSIECQLCNKIISSVGMFTHLRDSHNISVNDYCMQYGEYRPSKLREIEYKERLETSNNKQICVICNQEFASGNLLGGHIKRDHLISKKEYVNKYIFNGIHPICKCGCGRNVKLLNYYPYKVEYITGHNSIGETNSMFGKHFSKESKMKMSEKAVKRIETYVGKKIDTEPELRFKSLLDKFIIEYRHPHEVNLGDRMASIDFYLPEKDLLVEIDGEYWHPDKLENLNFHRIPNIISDKQKVVLKNLVRIRSLDLEKYEKIDDKDKLLIILSNQLNNNFTIPTYKQKIINKEYFKQCIDNKSKEYLSNNSWLLLKFIRTFQPTLPYPDLEENLIDVVYRISNYDLSKIYNETTKEFSNNTSAVGHNYLKHYFHSYWKSKFNGNPSPEEAWLDDKIMKEVIEYRIGCNDNNEVYDFSLHQLVRGLSARRVTVSFFKPLLAAAIYFTLLGNKEIPIVLDPCCGFGGRLLGFKSKYPNGRYIGCEPNIETYNELLQLVKNANWDGVEIYNCKFEDFRSDINFDLVFTSIPYYNVEIYSNNTDYKSFEDWKNTFIGSFERYNNCYLNVPPELSNKLGWNNKINYKIISNRSHFDSRSGSKEEFIVKM